MCEYPTRLDPRAREPEAGTAGGTICFEGTLDGSDRLVDGYMPLQDYIDEAIALFQADPSAPEILVERVKPLRFAEREGQTEEWLARLAAV